MARDTHLLMHIERRHTLGIMSATPKTPPIVVTLVGVLYCARADIIE